MKWQELRKTREAAERYLGTEHPTDESEFRRRLGRYLHANGWKTEFLRVEEQFCLRWCRYHHPSGAEVYARPFFLWQRFNGGESFEEMFPLGGGAQACAPERPIPEKKDEFGGVLRGMEEHYRCLHAAEEYQHQRLLHRIWLSDFARLLWEYLSDNGWETHVVKGSDYFCWWRCEFTHPSGAKVCARPFFLWQRFNEGEEFEELFPRVEETDIVKES